MAKYVREIMNPELFAVEPDAPRDAALDYLLALGITACPVIDEAGGFKGMVTLADLMSEGGGNRAADRISNPIITIAANATIDEAARKLADLHAHRIVAIDDKGRAAGMVSAVDLVAALVGLPVNHPEGFPRIDAVAGLSWSPDLTLEADQGEQVPPEPGVLVLIYGRAGSEEVPVWIEHNANLRARIDDMLNLPQDAQAQLALILERDRRHLRFRVAVVSDPGARQAAAEALSADAARRRRLG
ncbi:MAG: CBS domain-containing protein [Myxococcales bacterium]|nr:CBS domain-containing protein [Myxococcales bacterium]